MKSISIVAIVLCALVAFGSSAPIVDEQQQTELARVDIGSFLYDNILQQLFSGLVTNTFNTLSGTLNNLIQTNPLGIGKRDLPEDLQQRVDIGSFLYDNILQQLFSGIVSNTFNTVSNTLNNLIQTNPLGIGKRDDAEGRVDIGSFLYDNILQNLFSGLVTNSANYLQGSLLNLINSNPLGIGKRDDAEGRVDIGSFLYDNILQNLFSGLVTNSASYLQNSLLNLINNNPLGIGKRDDAEGRVDIGSFLYDNILQGLFSGLVSNSANYLQNSLLNLINSNPLGIGKRSVNGQQADTIIVQTISTLVQQFQTFAQQAVSVWTDKQKLATLVKANIDNFKLTINKLAEQLVDIIPSNIAADVDQLLARLQSMLIFWTSGLGGSLGPVIGPFPQ